MDDEHLAELRAALDTIVAVKIDLSCPDSGNATSRVLSASKANDACVALNRAIALLKHAIGPLAAPH